MPNGLALPNNHRPASLHPQAHLHPLWLEALLTAGAALLLWHAAQALSLPGIDLGLGSRYAADKLPSAKLTLPNLLLDAPLHGLSKPERAVALSRYAPYWLPALAILGWLGLPCARRGGRPGLGAIIVLCSAMAWAVRAFGWPAAVWCSTALCGGVLSIGAWLRQRGQGEVSGCALRDAFPRAWAALVWPGWVAFTGLGWLWIADFAARGPVGESVPGASCFGVKQADGLVIANTALLLAAALRAQIVVGIARVISHLGRLWLRPRGPQVLTVGAAALAVGLGMVGRPTSASPLLPGIGPSGLGMPHVSGEILRLLACISIAWFAYRFGEWGGTAPRVLRGLALAGVPPLLAALGFVVASDMGPALVMALATLLLVGVAPLRWWTAHRSPRVVVAVMATAVVVLAVAGWRFSLVEWAPLFSDAAARRLQPLSDPFAAASPNYAQVLWLIDAAPPLGFGLGRVPYCGALAHVGLANCTLASGAPLQLASDFAFAGLAATWGAPGACLIAVSLLGWLTCLPLAAMPSPARVADAPPWSLFQVWLVAIACLAAQAQTVISVGGTLTWTPLTGVTLPVLGYGGTSLVATALWVGLAIGPAAAWRRPPRRQSEPMLVMGA